MNKFLVITTILVLTLAQGCYGSGYSSNGPYGTTTSRSAIGPLGGVSSSSQTVNATVDTRGYEACITAFTADNARAAGCRGDASTCSTPQYTQVQIMDACTLRAGYLNGSQFGMMPFGQFMPMYASGAFSGYTGYGAPMMVGPGVYAGGTYDPRNAGTIAAYDAQRQRALAAPNLPNTGSSIDAAQDEQIMREARFRADYCRENPRSAACQH